MTQHERLLKQLHYEPETGIWTRLRRINRHPAGEVAGRLCHDGYRQIGFEGKAYQEHRLVVFYMTGAWPAGRLDHRDLDKANNRWNNLREATPTQNNTNSRARGSSGFKGVTRHHRSGKWQAQIHTMNKNLYLGLFDTKEAANAAYGAAAATLFGEFARAE